MSDDTEPGYVWQVTCSESEDGGKGVNVALGSKLADLPLSDDAKLYGIGKALINLGTQLLTSTTNEDDEWDD